MFARRLAIWTFTALAMVSIIACGGSAQSSPPNVPGAIPGTAAATEANVDPPSDLCASLTADQVGAAAGATYEEGVEDGGRCGWNLQSGTGNVTIDRSVPAVAALAVGSESVPGLGDQASCTCGKRLAVLGVVTGDSGFIVQVSGVEDSAAGAKAVAALVLDAAAAP